MESVQVRTRLNGRTFVGTLEPETPDANIPTNLPACFNRGVRAGQTPLWLVLVSWNDDGSKPRKYGVASDTILAGGVRKIWMRPLYQSSDRKMKAYSRNANHQNHGFNLYLNADGTARIAKTGARIVGRGKRFK